eukprot:Gb_06454 [translate_table: standard]
MRRKSFEDPTKDALSIRGRSPEKKKNNSGDRQWISRVKKPDKGKSPDAAPSTEMKTFNDEVGDVYLASSSTHSCHDAWYTGDLQQRKLQDGLRSNGVSKRSPHWNTVQA